MTDKAVSHAIERGIDILFAHRLAVAYFKPRLSAQNVRSSQDIPYYLLPGYWPVDVKKGPER
jgi:hypothetical protein